MTQSSRPQAGNKNPVYGNPAFIDAGPWSRNQWAQKLIIEWVGDAVTTRGPFAKYLNRLEVTNPVGREIHIDTGAGYCNGSLLDSTEAVIFTPGVPGIASRSDRVVMVENNTAVAYTGAASGVILEFPTVLTDYSGVASVPPYACRLAILRGDGATGNPTALVQDDLYWMVEIASYNITNVPAVNTLTDLRDYVDAEIKYMFAPVMLGMIGGPVFLYPEVMDVLGITTTMGITMDDGSDVHVYGRIEAPTDYITDMTVKGVSISVGKGGNIYASLAWFAGTCAESYATHNGTSGLAAEAIDATVNLQNCNRSIAITGISPGDIMYFDFFRESTNVLDTLDEDFCFIGFLIEYLGWR